MGGGWGWEWVRPARAAEGEGEAKAGLHAGPDCSLRRLSVMRQCSTLVEVSADYAHVSVHPIRAAVVAGSPGVLFHRQ